MTGTTDRLSVLLTRIANGDADAPAATRQGAHRLRSDKARSTDNGHDAGGQISHQKLQSMQ